MTPTQLVQNGLCDVVKVFIKGEPHSHKKISEGRFRIISSVSLVDQIVTRLTSMNQNKTEIKLWESCPSAPGMGLNDDGLRVVWEVANQFSKEGIVCETDVSGWDWSVQEWELDLDADCRVGLMGEELHGLMHFFLRTHSYIVSHSVFAVSDGSLYEQVIPGGQLSGDYNTSSTNSRCRVIATMAARWKQGIYTQFSGGGIKAMGDDSFEIWFEGIVEALESIGHTIKMCVQRPNLENFEFCSQVFVERGVAYPVDFSKTLFRFLSHNPADPRYNDYRVQLLWCFRHLPTDLYNQIDRLARARVDRAQTLAVSGY